ncbi:MAG: sulfurtransferase TusA family protein [Promethearchaeota archaeon]|nr:MAG: sulfurtransferase TusA family protein [Candidatus Lokiarchaeota archaeon]
MPNTYTLNCIELVCPLPVARTKKKLSEMQSGEILEVIGDFGESGENILKFSENQGYIVLKSQIEMDHYFIKIQKP